MTAKTGRDRDRNTAHAAMLDNRVSDPGKHWLNLVERGIVYVMTVILEIRQRAGQ